MPDILDAPVSGVREALQAAFAEDDKAPEPVAAAPEPEPPTVEPQLEPQQEPEQPAEPAAEAADADKPDDRPRDEHGRFKAKDSEPESDEPVEQAASEAQEGPRVAPPKRWNDTAKVKWNRLPRAVQEELARLDSQSAMGDLAEVLEPHMDRIRAVHGEPKRYVGNLIAYDQWIARDPVSAIANLIKQTGIDPRAFVQQTPQPQPEANAEERYVDPDLKAALDEINGLKSKLSQFEQYQHTSQQTAAQRERARIAQEIESFRVGHEYFDVLENDMVPFINAGLSLQDAYDRAMWANPTVRGELQRKEIDAERQRIEAERKREADAARARAEQAKRAAGSVTGSPGPGASPAAGQAPTLRAELERTFAQVGARI